MDRLTPLEQFADLREISSNVSDYLDRELYVDSFGFDSDYTTNDILAECYTIIIQELREIGVKMNDELEDLLTDWYTAKHLYHLRVLVDARTLIELCQDKDVKNKLDQLVTSEDGVDDTLQDFVEFLMEKYPKETSYRYIYEFSASYYSTHRFNNHVTTILDKLDQQDPTADLPNIDAALSYVQRVILLRSLATKAVNMILDGLQLRGTCDLKLIRKILNDYDMDKISTDDLRIYSLIDNPAVEVEPRLEKFKEAMMLKHHQRAMHHMEYWLKHHETPPQKENLILLVAHHYEPESTPESFIEEINQMIDMGLEILTPEDIEFMKQTAQCILTQGFKSPTTVYSMNDTE